MSHRVRTLTSAAVAAPADLAGVCLAVVLDYDPDDPLAATLTFRGNQDYVTWTVARDLLRDGLTAMSGPGDVSAWAGPDDPQRYYLRIKSGSGSTVLSFPIHEVECFLAQAYGSIPVGTEFTSVDLDAELNAILGEAA
jgi:hypothetical protein